EGKASESLSDELLLACEDSFNCIRAKMTY
ncbi:MAG: hypothetical protein ACI934_000605, partial [Pseudohongiellaceae bacterium]